MKALKRKVELLSSNDDALRSALRESEQKLSDRLAKWQDESKRAQAKLEEEVEQRVEQRRRDSEESLRREFDKKEERAREERRQILEALRNKEISAEVAATRLAALGDRKVTS